MENPSLVRKRPPQRAAQTRESAFNWPLPGGGAYWLEFLAPYLRERGLYIAASRDAGAAPNYVADHKRLLAKLAADPARYGTNSGFAVSVVIVCGNR